MQDWNTVHAFVHLTSECQSVRFITTSRQALWPAHCPSQWIPAVSFLRVERPERETHFIAGAKNEWFSPNPPTCFRSLVLKHKDNITSDFHALEYCQWITFSCRRIFRQFWLLVINVVCIPTTGSRTTLTFQHKDVTINYSSKFIVTVQWNAISHPSLSLSKHKFN